MRKIINISELVEMELDSIVLSIIEEKLDILDENYG